MKRSKWFACLTAAVTIGLCACTAADPTDPAPSVTPPSPPPSPPPPPPPSAPPTPSGDAGRGFIIWSADGSIRAVPAPAGIRELLPVDINDSGEVAGIVIDPSGGYIDAFVWSESAGLRRLGVVTGFAGGVIVTGINAQGTVTGYKHSFAGSVVRSFVASGDAGFELLPGEQVGVVAINDAGTVVGSAPGGPFRRLADGSFRPLEQTASECTAPTDINNRGIVLGWSGNELYGMGCVPQAWILWRDGFPITEITNCPTGCRLEFRAFNDENVAVGNLPDTAVRVSLGTGSLLAMERLPGAFGYGVNDRGDIAGAMKQPGAPPFMNTVPVIWLAGGAVVRLPLPAGSTRGSAFAINKRGDVVGTVY